MCGPRGGSGVSDDVPIELVGSVVQIIVELGVAPRASASVPTRDKPPWFPLQRRTLLCNPSADAVDVKADVHAIGDRLVVAILHHQVSVEVPNGLLRRGGGQAD